MIQLTYQPALDPFHTIFRIVELNNALNGVELEKARIADFYLVYPFEIDEIRLKPEHRRFKALARKYANRRPYAMLPTARSRLSRMKPVFQAAAQTLVKHGYLDRDAFNSGRIKRTSVNEPPMVHDAVNDQVENDKELIEFLVLLMTEYPLLGENGIKSRTHLMDYRADAT